MYQGRHIHKHLTRLDYRVLAALLLADGEYVRAKEIGLLLFDRPMGRMACATRVWSLIANGVDTIQSDRPRGSCASRGYRLIDVPPDEHLDGMLREVPAVKRSRWWKTRTAAAERIS